MKLTLSFIFVAIALLQVTTASPVAEVTEVKKRDQKKFAYLVARDLSDADDVQSHGRKNIAYSVAEDLSDAEEVKKRDQKKFAYLVARDPSDADDVQSHGRKNIAYSVAEDLFDAEEVKKRDQKKFAYLVARDLSDADDVQSHGRKNIAYSVAEDLSDAGDVEKRAEKTFSYIVAEESRDVEGAVEGCEKANGKSVLVSHIAQVSHPDSPWSTRAVPIEKNDVALYVLLEEGWGLPGTMLMFSRYPQSIERWEANSANPLTRICVRILDASIDTASKASSPSV
ncbi:uncharacterized protein BJ212DRAFT_1589303 [Suillus subaureus]|uniref:Uncharacterized protein n=1 Tax=Suillus subaureus TaxID=48587 RepID=A0A9P7JB05_9AGAM|nr:uncharacterized protein BJ212DRAFT_1589303 [Suillus subaureus]KAG1811880.1 hypothetical protein BJ212DRAFT_1589303 [Suillus subaureus]